MTEHEINSILAEKIMGWHKAIIPIGDDQGVTWWHDSSGLAVTHHTNFNPIHDANDQQQLREKLAELGHEWSLLCDKKSPRFTFIINFTFTINEPIWVASGETEGEALARCCFAMLGIPWPDKER